jgi:hypothetical protein
MMEEKSWEGYINLLKNKFFNLLCTREENGEWEKFLDSLIIEIAGFDESHKNINYWRLYNKTNSLKYLRY